MKIDNESKNVNQLEKYARNNSNTEYGFVISLFKEAEEIKINIKGVAIKEFIPLTYTDQILKFLSDCNFKNYGTSAIP